MNVLSLLLVREIMGCVEQRGEREQGAECTVADPTGVKMCFSRSKDERRLVSQRGSKTANGSRTGRARSGRRDHSDVVRMSTWGPKARAAYVKRVRPCERECPCYVREEGATA